MSDTQPTSYPSNPTNQSPVSQDNTLTFQDLVILKQFLEKGFRENFFNNQEKGGAVHLQTKLSNIIQEVLARNIDAR